MKDTLKSLRTISCVTLDNVLFTSAFIVTISCNVSAQKNYFLLHGNCNLPFIFKVETVMVFLSAVQIFCTFLASYRQKLNQIKFNPLKPELNPICYLLALLGVHHFLQVSRIRVKLLTFRLLMSYIYGASILDVFRSHTTTQHSR